MPSATVASDRQTNNKNCRWSLSLIAVAVADRCRQSLFVGVELPPTYKILYYNDEQDYILFFVNTISYSTQRFLKKILIYYYRIKLVIVYPRVFDKHKNNSRMVNLLFYALNQQLIEMHNQKVFLTNFIKLIKILYNLMPPLLFSQLILMLNMSFTVTENVTDTPKFKKLTDIKFKKILFTRLSIKYLTMNQIPFL